jgi:hypothetical protein
MVCLTLSSMFRVRHGSLGATHSEPKAGHRVNATSH